MNTVLWWLGQNAIAVAVLIPVVLVVGRLFRTRPAVRHALWLVVLLKFVTPPVVAWPWTVDQVRESVWATPRTSADTGVTEVRPVPLVVMPTDIGGNRAGLPVPGPVEFAVDLLPRPEAEGESAEATPAPTVADRDPDLAGNAARLVLAVWLVGVAGCAAWQVRRLARHAAFVRGGAAAPQPLTDEIHGLARRLGVRPPVALIARGIRSPFVWCLGRLRLVWPEALSGRGEVVRARGVIAHELAHVRRGDHWVAWLELLAGVVWWWNPLFWYVRRRLRETAEMACDALAIGTRPDSRREYAEMLLELSAGFEPGGPAHVLAVGAGSPSSFERRLSMILSDNTSGKVSFRGVAVAIVFALVSLPGWSAGQAKPPVDPPRSSPADDPVLRDLIEQGKFTEAKARLEALRTKQAADRAVAEGMLPEKWKDALLKELPSACIKGFPKNTPLSWKVCMSCHTGPKEGEGGGASKAGPPLNEWKPKFVNEAPGSKVPAIPFGTPAQKFRSGPNCARS